MNNDYEMDGASFSSRSETDFLSFLNEREDNAFRRREVSPKPQSVKHNTTSRAV